MVKFILPVFYYFVNVAIRSGSHSISLGLFSSVQFSRSVVSDSLRPNGSSLPGAAVQGILQVRMLEWVAMPFFKGLSGPRNQICISLVSCTGR